MFSLFGMNIVLVVPFSSFYHIQNAFTSSSILIILTKYFFRPETTKHFLLTKTLKGKEPKNTIQRNDFEMNEINSLRRLGATVNLWREPKNFWFFFHSILVVNI